MRQYLHLESPNKTFQTVNWTHKHQLHISYPVEWRKSLTRQGSPALVQRTAYRAWGFQIATKQLPRKAHQHFQWWLSESDELHKGDEGRRTVWPDIAFPTACFRHKIPLPKPSLACLLVKHQQKVGGLFSGAMKPAQAASREGQSDAWKLARELNLPVQPQAWLGTTYKLGLRKKGEVGDKHSVNRDEEGRAVFVLR